MMKSFSMAALVALLLSLPTATYAAKKSSPAPAATPAPSATPAEATSGKHIPMYSEVTTIDTAGKSWVHKNKDGKEVKFVVTDKTEIKNNGAAAKFDEIKVGDWVAGSRVKKSDTEYEVVKITKFGARTEKSEKSEKSAKATPAKTS
jgi:hypothetical protein